MSTKNPDMDILDQSYSYGDSILNRDSRNQPLKIHLFGGPISHSLSPLVNSILFKHARVPWTYNLNETTSGQHFQDVSRQLDCIGAAITMPNKVTFMPLLDDLTEEARAIGAVNTVFIRSDVKGQKRYIGSNTDCIGIRDALLNNDPKLAENAKGHPALVVGAGGAARSAIYALWRWFKPSEIYLVNRLKSEVDDLVSGMEKSIPGIKLFHIESLHDVARLPTPTVVVGTVPDNLPREPGEILAWRICEAFLRNRQRNGAVLDMCYHPARTRLLRLAEANGWTPIFGTEVMVRVNVAQNILWLEKKPDEDGVREALLSIQAASKL